MKKYSSHGKRLFFCLLFCIAMLVAPLLSQRVMAIETCKPMKANKGLYNNDKKKQSQSQEYDYGSSGFISKAAWIHNLVILFDMGSEEVYEPERLFRDITSDNPYYNDIVLALAYGVLSADEGNNFNPGAFCTRDFAVHTLNFCLGYQLQENKYAFSDTSATKYPDDAQIALDHHWLSMNNGMFCPDYPITSDEAKTMISYAEKEWGSTDIDETYKNQYEFSDEVKVVNSGISVEAIDKDVVRIYDSTQDIVEGDVFVAYIDELPAAYQAKKINKTESAIEITVTSVSMEDYLKDADSQGTADLDLDDFVPAEGVTITKTDTDAVAEANRKKAKGTKEIKTKTMKGTLKITEGADVNFVCKFSKLYMEYQIDTASSNYYVAINGNANLSCTANFDLIDFIGQKKQVSLGKLPVTGVGSVSLNLVLDVSGRVTVSYVTNFSAGIKYSNGNIRLVKKFGHIDPSIDSQIDLQMGLRASAEFNFLNLVKGEIYAEGGLKGNVASKAYSDTPKICTTIKFWCYAEIGAGVSIPGKNFSQQETLINEKNGLLIKAHFEDGAWRVPCSRNPKEWFSSIYSSKYASVGISGYMDDAGEYIPVFTYELNDNGNAIITGYTGYARTLTIPDTVDGHTVVAIGASAFKNRTDLKSVAIPNTVTQLMDSCFANCTALSSIELGNSIETIASYAFSGCISLVDAHLPESVSMIGCGSFKDCVSLYSLYVPKALKTDSLMGANQYYPGAFEGCSNLQSVAFEKNILSLPDSLFVNCEGLKEIVIPDTVTSLNGGGGFAIDLGVFENCANLEKVTLSANLASMGCGTFRNCISLKDIELPDSLSYIDVAAFKNCKSLESINIPAKLQTDGMVGTDSHYDGVFAGCENLKTVIFGSGIKIIPQGLFARCTGLCQIRIPDTVETINTWAFSYCTALEEIQIPNNVKNLGNAVFQGCSALKSVKLSQNIEDIPEYLFEKCSSLSAVEIPSKVTHIGKYAFANCSNLTDITLSAAIASIDAYAFSACEKLSEITIPDQVGMIGSYAFEKCKALSNVEISSSVTKIGSGVFYDCDGLSEIIIPNNVREIGKSVFSNCDNLTKVKLSNGIYVIPENAFEQCGALESIIIPYRVTEIQKGAFADSPAFKEITIPKATTTIAASAFSYKSILTIYGLKGSYAELYSQNEGISFNSITKPVTDIFISQKELELLEGSTAVLLIDILPEDFTEDVIWKSGDDSIVTIDDAGIVKAKKIGTATVTVTAGAKSVNCTIRVVKETSITPSPDATPKPGITPSKHPASKPAISSTPKPIKKQTYRKKHKTIKKPSRVKIKKIKRSGKKCAKVTWGKVKCNDGYQIQYARKKSFSGKKKTTSYSKSCYIYGKSKKTYYVRVRAVNWGYISQSRMGYKYGKWSKAKKIKLK